MENKEFSEVASLNMRAVVRETGLKPDTLRAWERRYGIPQPKRSAGGHRLYSPHDIELLKWLIARQEEGLSISRATALWHQLEAEGQDPFQSLPYTTHQTIMATLAGATIDGLRDEWLHACKTFDEGASDQILTRAFGIFPPETVCFQILMKGLAEIGRGWYAGEISVQQEHFASELAGRRVKALLAASPPPTLHGRILILCSPEEEHTFSALVLSYLLRRVGRNASFMGANVPLQKLDHMLTTAQPDLVILIAYQLQTAANLLSVAEFLQEEGVPIAFGGRIFNLLPDLQEQIPGYYLGDKMEQASEIVSRLLKNSGLQPHGTTLSQEYRETLDLFQSKQIQLESTLLAEMKSNGMESTQITIANRNMSRNILASLQLGNITFLRGDIEWIGGLLANYKIPPELLKDYITSYSRILNELTNHKVQIITDFLASLDFH